MDDIETRAGGDVGLEVRGVAKVLRGHAIVFGQRSENLGGFREIISPEAVDRTLREGVDLRALVDHDSARLLGRMSAGTLRVAKSVRGLQIEIDPPETTVGHDIVESVRRRDVTGMSFAFRAIKDTWDESTDPPTRTVSDMLIREVSLVTWPAYPQTEVAMRSLYQARGVPPPARTVTERLAASGKRLTLPPRVG